MYNSISGVIYSVGFLEEIIFNVYWAFLQTTFGVLDSDTCGEIDCSSVNAVLISSGNLLMFFVGTTNSLGHTWVLVLVNSFIIVVVLILMETTLKFCCVSNLYISSTEDISFIHMNLSQKTLGNRNLTSKGRRFLICCGIDSIFINGV